MTLDEHLDRYVAERRRADPNPFWDTVRFCLAVASLGSTIGGVIIFVTAAVTLDYGCTFYALLFTFAAATMTEGLLLKCPACQGSGHIAGKPGFVIRYTRAHTGMSVETLASKCGVSASLLYKIETGTRDMSLSKARRIADALGIRVADLLQD